MTLVLALGWIASGWWGGVNGIRVGQGYLYCSLGRGHTYIVWMSGANPTAVLVMQDIAAGRFIGESFGSRPAKITLRDRFFAESPNARFSSGAFGMLLPLWIPLLLVAIPAAWCWWLDHKPGRGRCPECGYDLAGIASGVCPECGAAIPRQAAGADGA